MSIWVKTWQATDPEFPCVISAVLHCAQGATAALSRRMPATLTNQAWPSKPEGSVSCPPRCELTIAGPHTTLASFVTVAKKPGKFGKDKAVPRYELTIKTFFPDELFDAYDDLRAAWDRLAPHFSVAAPIQSGTGSLFEDGLLPFTAPKMLEQAQALTAILPARFEATLTTEDWPTSQSPKPFPDKMALRILGSGVPLAWVILTRSKKTHGRPAYEVEVDKSFPDTGEFAAANDAFWSLRNSGIEDSSR